jgi:hypothetical protein
MWPITPSQPIPHELGIARPGAKSRAQLDAEHNTEERRHRRRQRRREGPDESREVDTFERTAERD